MDLCRYCDEPVEGTFMELEDGSKLHVECNFRMIAGSAAHQLGECSCVGGSREDPPGLSKRDAARLAFETGGHLLKAQL